MRLGAGDLTRIRAQVSLSALESLAVHLGGLREGRKSILFVSQGPPMRAEASTCTGALRDVIVAANRNNVTIHTLDPRQLGEARLMSDANAALSADTGGRRIGLTNDFSRPLQGVMADASTYYLLGYESPATTADGKFRKIDVDVRTERRARHRTQRATGRRGPRSCARRPRRRPRPTIPPEVAEALDSLRDQARRIAVTDWIGAPAARLGTKPGHGRARGAGRARRRRESAPSSSRSRGPTASSRLRPRRSRSRPACGPLRFEAPPGGLRTRATVKNAAGEEIDSWSRDTIVPPRPTAARWAPRSSTGRPASLQYRALMAGAPTSPSADAPFPAHRSRDRPAGDGRRPKAPVDVQLLNRQGVPLKTLSAVLGAGRRTTCRSSCRWAASPSPTTCCVSPSRCPGAQDEPSGAVHAGAVTD